MPLFKIQAPDGRVLQVNAPDGQTALGMAQQQYAQAKPVDPLNFAVGAMRQTAAGVPVVGGMLNRANAATNAALAPVVEPLLDMIPGHDKSQDIRGGNFAQRYQRDLGMQNQTDASFQSAHPVASTAANVGGGILGALGLSELAPLRAAAPAAKGMLAGLKTAAQAVGTGATIGAADGAVRAPSGQRLQGAVAGGLTGGALVGGATVAAGLAKAAAKPIVNAIADRLGPAVQDASVSAGPARQAASFVTRKLGAAGLDLPTLQASPADTAAEAGGNSTRNTLAALARQPGATAENVQAQLGERATGRANRILNVVSQATGVDPSAARGNIEALVAKGQADATPLFDQVRATPGPVWNPDLASLAERPAMKKALGKTVEAMQNAGQDPLKVGLAVDPDTGLFKVDSNDLSAVTEPQPTAGAWENVRQILGDLGKESPNMSNTQRLEARGYQATQRDLTSILAGDDTGQGALIPGYRDALNVAGDYKSAEGAFNGARGKLFSQKFGPADLSDMLDGATDGEKSAIQHAMAADMYDAAQNNSLSLNSLKKPAFQSKLTLAFGPDAAGQIGNTLTNEAGMADAERQIMPQNGSQTAPLSAEIKSQQENPLGDFTVDAVTGAIRHGPTGVAEAGLKAGIKSLTAAAKTPGLGTDARDEAGRLLLMSPQDLHSFLQTNNFNPQPAAPSTSPLPFMAGVAGGQLAGRILPQQPQPQPQPQPAQ